MPPAITRAERALATRRRMVSSAYRLFCDNGYPGTTMNAIASEAGVAVQTLYYTFHTKAELLGEALGAAIVGFDTWRKPPPDPEMAELLPWHGWWAAFQAAPSSVDALPIFVTHGVKILERVSPLIAAMHGAAGDPDAAAIVKLGERRQIDAYREVVRALARKAGGLRRGLSEDAATDVVFALFSAEVYRSLATTRGWSLSRCSRFFGDLLAAQLLELQPPTARASRRPR